MSSPMAELPGEDAERGWRDYVADVSSAASRLLSTRLAMFREELSVKAVFAARGFAFGVVAAAMAVGTLLMAAALLAAVFAKLFGSVILGILATVVLYGAGTAAAGIAAFRSISRVRPFEFPATGEELARDREALAAALAPEEPLSEGADVPQAGREAPVDLEERFRAGSE